MLRNLFIDKILCELFCPRIWGAFKKCTPGDFRKILEINCVVKHYFIA